MADCVTLVVSIFGWVYWYNVKGTSVLWSSAWDTLAYPTELWTTQPMPNRISIWLGSLAIIHIIRTVNVSSYLRCMHWWNKAWIPFLWITSSRSFHFSKSNSYSYKADIHTLKTKLKNDEYTQPSSSQVTTDWPCNKKHSLVKTLALIQTHHFCINLYTENKK